MSPNRLTTPSGMMNRRERRRVDAASGSDDEIVRTMAGSPTRNYFTTSTAQGASSTRRSVVLPISRL
jgi:hypothetical protein